MRARKLGYRELLLEPVQGLEKRLRERAPESECLADRAHLGAKHRLGVELLPVETGSLDGDVIERRLEGCRGLAGDVVRKLVERVADGEQRRQLGDREAGRLRGERRGARDARIHLDQDQLARIGLVGELNVGTAGGHADGAGAGEGGLAQALILGIGKGLLRRDRPGVAGVYAHRVDVLDRANDHAVSGPVDHHFELELLPAVQRALD